jgi:ferrous iron transport protein A
MRLSELKVGHSGFIVSLAMKGATRHRFLEMGFVRGERILVKRVAPLGDPVEYLIKGYHLALRKRDAANVIVEPRCA